MYTFPLLRAKVQRPPLRAATLHRDRLLDWLEANVQRRVMFVVADAGYGKTTLLADFSRRSRVRTTWYRLDQDDGNWISFLHYLVAAGREANPEFAPQTAAMLKEIATGGPSRDAILGTFLRELPALVAGDPLAIILDDYHLVDESADVRHVMGELIARAPDGLSVIVLSRRNPTLPIARALVSAEFTTLSTDDLRFRDDETDQLFRDTYRRVLEPDIVSDLTRRTEGWPASLQLVESALRSRPLAEARSFVRNLSGARGELYDYLAEEVVGDLDEALQVFLMRTSILQTVDPELAAILVDLDESGIRDLIARSERVGLLARRGADNREAFRYHPLVRDFLGARLRRDEGDAGVALLHRSVAAHTERRDWHVAAYHYAAAGSTDDLYRVLASSIKSIMAGGEYALVDSYVDTASVELPPELEIVLSRMDIERGRLEDALSKAERAHSRLASIAGGATRELATANLMAVHHLLGNAARALEFATQLASFASEPTLLMIARGTVSILESSTDGSLAACEALLQTMANDQRANGQSHYLGITLLNLGVNEKARGRAEVALRFANEAIEILVQGSTNSELHAARRLRAWALAHLGDWAAAKQEMTALLGVDVPVADRTDTVVTWAEILTLYGGSIEAQQTVYEALHLPAITGEARLLLPMVVAQYAIRVRNLDEARAILATQEMHQLSFIVAHEARKKTLRAHLILVEGGDARQALQQAELHASAQGADFCRNVAKVLTATSLPKDQLNEAVLSLAASQHVYLSILAETVCERLVDLSEPAMRVVTAEAQKRPDRWRDALRPRIDGPNKTSIAAARILDRVGSKEDIQLLRALSRRLGARGSEAALGRDLARRLAPRVFVEDQGRVKVLVDGQALRESEVRRKVLALLCFLISRPGLSGTRDEVLEALWPGAEPSAGLNSLNQTLYFLRRVLESPYVEDQSPGYVHHDSDVLWLDGDLVSSRSIESQRLVEEIHRKPTIDAIERLSDQYRGRFALDFAYEDWAAGYRDNLHAAYLEVVEQAVLADTRAGQFSRAIELARRALSIDPSAEQMERHLLRLYHQAGSHAAAAEQFSHYAIVVRDELGLEPPSLDEILSD